MRFNRAVLLIATAILPLVSSRFTVRLYRESSCDPSSGDYSELSGRGQDCFPTSTSSTSVQCAYISGAGNIVEQCKGVNYTPQAISMDQWAPSCRFYESTDCSGNGRTLTAAVPGFCYRDSPLGGTVGSIQCLDFDDGEKGDLKRKRGWNIFGL